MSTPTHEDELFDPAKHAELVENIKQLALKDPDALKRFARGAFADKEGEKLVEGVAKSRDIINNVKAAFVTIGAALVVIDQKKLVLQGKQIQAFAPEWQGISETFDNIMKDSQKVSARAAVTAQQFSDVLIEVLLDHSTTKSDAHDVLNQYKAEVHEEQDAAGKIGTQLTNLHGSINNFSATLVAVLDQDSAIKKEIENVRAAIAVLDARIESLDKLINGCMWSAIGGGIGLVAGMFLCLTPLAPLGAALMIGSVGSAAGAGVGAESWGRQVSAARKQKAEQQAQLDKLIQTEKDLQEVHGHLAKLDGEWVTIAKGLAAISQVWGAFSSSLIEIEESLTKTDGHMMKDGKVWQKVYLLDLQLLQAIYARLGQMLGQWSANVTAVYYADGPAPPYKA